jgi:hypothetical protein
MRKRAPSCSTFAISRYGPCKHAYCLAHLVLLKEKLLQKPFITVSPAVLQCCSILPMRLQSPDWSRKSIEEVCYLMSECRLEHEQSFVTTNLVQFGGLFA